MAIWQSASGSERRETAEVYKRQCRKDTADLPLCVCRKAENRLTAQPFVARIQTERSYRSLARPGDRWRGLRCLAGAREPPETSCWPKITGHTMIHPRLSHGSAMTISLNEREEFLFLKLIEEFYFYAEFYVAGKNAFPNTMPNGRTFLWSIALSDWKSIYFESIWRGTTSTEYPHWPLPSGISHSIEMLGEHTKCQKLRKCALHSISIWPDIGRAAVTRSSNGDHS